LPKREKIHAPSIKSKISRTEKLGKTKSPELNKFRALRAKQTNKQTKL
jgi:hypothetical protein